MRSLHLRLERSPLLERVVTIIHALAMLAVWASQVPVAAAMLLSGIILVSWRFQRGRHFGTGHGTSLLYSERTGWRIAAEGTEPEDLVILDSSVVSPWLIVLHGRVGRKRRQWVIPRDSCDAEGFRALRVYLRILPRGLADTGDPPAGSAPVSPDLAA